MAGPSDHEQLLLELINDARLDPLGNAARYITSYSPLTSGNADIQNALSFFAVNGVTLQSAFAALAPAAPLAWNESLGNAAEGHSNVMLAQDTQTHQGNGEADLATRVLNAGYSFSRVGENVFAFTKSALQGHAGFMVDWGGSPATGGMQSPPGHRNNIMNPLMREIGIGVVVGSGANVGPLLVTEDLGNRSSAQNFILGVAYNDNDHDNFYSLGEGLGSLQLALGAASTTSAASGGYTLETGAAGLQNVALSGAGLTGTVNVGLSLSGTSSVKLDVIDGDTLHTSASATVSGAITTLAGLGTIGLTLKVNGGAVHTLTGTSGNDRLTGGIGKDTLSGGAGSDVLKGIGGADNLKGLAGADKLYGGTANDKLSGGTGADKFYFDTALTGNKDTILDFSHGQADKIVLDDDVFRKFTGKFAIAAGNLHIGAAAADTNDFINYNPDTGELTYDANGITAGGAPKVFAVLGAASHPATLVAADFQVIA